MPSDDIIKGLIPIDDAARDGRPCLVNAGDEYAAAYWTGHMWAYNRRDDADAVEQIDFEPIRYKSQEVRGALFQRFALRAVKVGEE